MTMTLDEFRTAVRVLPDAEAGAVRHRFAGAFLRAGGHEPPMWNALRHRQRVSLARLWATVAGRETVMVMWDHPDLSAGRPPHPTAFSPCAVLECRVADLERGVDWLPDDLYVFDDTYTWSAVFTHQADVDGMVVLLARAESVA